MTLSAFRGNRQPSLLHSSMTGIEVKYCQSMSNLSSNVSQIFFAGPAVSHFLAARQARGTLAPATVRASQLFEKWSGRPEYTN